MKTPSRINRRRLVLPLLLALSACTPASQGAPTRLAIADSTLPPMKVFAAQQVQRPTRSNAGIARDFLDLSFALESGRELEVFTRFEGPISLRVTGAPPASLMPDLNRLLARLRGEAGIDISRTDSRAANITVEVVPRSEIRRVLPQAACFVAPNVSSLSEYRGARRSPRTNWALLERREKMAIFVPNDVSPQEIRDCLHEELAQALGPLNDLYRLPDSVFNDDNVHTVLTGFDMLVLRATYAPELRTGMTRQQVAARLPDVLDRINPRGAGGGIAPARQTPLEWSQAIETALGPGAGAAQRRNAANQAIRIARDRGWTDQRLAFAHYAMGRLLQGSDPETARQHYLAADRIYARSPDTRLHRAYVATQLAAYAISDGQGAEALRLVAPHVDAAVQSENAALLATLLLLRAEALELEGRVDEARAARLDSLGWARYGFGPDWAVRAKMREVADLRPSRPAIAG